MEPATHSSWASSHIWALSFSSVSWRVLQERETEARRQERLLGPDCSNVFSAGQRGCGVMGCTEVCVCGGVCGGVMSQEGNCWQVAQFCRGKFEPY